MKILHEEAKSYYKRFQLRFNTHSNPPIENLGTLVIPGKSPNRLKRKWCRYLLSSLLYVKISLLKVLLRLNCLRYVHHLKKMNT